MGRTGTHVTVGTSTGFGIEIVGQKPPWPTSCCDAGLCLLIGVGL
jgi:hypothetical protein